MSDGEHPATENVPAGPARKQGGRSGLGRAARTFLLPALLGAAISCAFLFVPPAGWTTNDVTTGQHPGYPDLQPRLYDSPVENVTQFAAAAATRLRNWRVKRTVPGQGVMVAEVRTALPFFTDDVSVTITEQRDDHGHTGALVTIRSRSRVGSGDLGENARHIRALQAAMDDKLPRLH